MCDAQFLNYASAINSVSDDTQDIVPTMLFYASANCGGEVQPQTNGAFITNPYTEGQTIAIPVTPFTSFFIPFNFTQVTFTSAASRTATFLGPYYVTDVSTLVWQTGTNAATTSWITDPPATVTFNNINNWFSAAMVPMCMGRLEFIGPYALTRYAPQTDRCDYFMQNTWCADNLNSTECACFKELPAIEAKSEKLGVDLPVICFGEECATENTYRTYAMLNKPCNLTICQQIIQESPGVINEGTDTVFCGGQFYNQTGNIVAPSTTPISNNTDTTSPEDAPFYVWVMLGVSGILFIVLIYLMFAQPPKRGNGTDIFSTIKKIKAMKQQQQSTI